jgi:hypothetical protein
MHACSLPLGATAFAVAISAAASAHNHLTVDTASGAAGDQIRIRAGYYPDETSFSISNGRLLYAGAIATYDVAVPLDQRGTNAGWISGDDVFLTSDFYAATGRLAGGSFRWEIAAVTPLAGGAGTLAWGAFDPSGSPFVPQCWSGAATRADRSFAVGLGGHNHDQGYAFSAPGLYDVTFVAWDANGRYAESLPLAVRFNVVPAPGAVALVGLGILGGSRRRRR